MIVALVTCLLALVGFAWADTAPSPGLTPFAGRYELRLNGFKVGEATVEMSRSADGRVVYRRESRAKGVLALIRDDRIQEQAVSQLEGPLFQPLTFEYRHVGGGQVREETVRFDWTDALAYSNHRGKPAELTIESGVLDRMTLELAVMRDVAAGREVLTYPVVAYGKRRDWHFQRQGQEYIETPAGRFLALVVKRDHQNSKRATTFWLAPDLAYLPVRVVYREKNGDRGELLLLKVEFL